MNRTLTLHIGTPKSGTTHLQAIVQAGRDRLRRAGILYPGAGYLPRDGFNQQPAIYALAGPTIGWVDDDVRRGAIAHLHRLCEEVSTHHGHTLLSAESLAFFETASAETLLDRLGYDPSSVTVVITARDLGRLLPSIWQQNIKNGATQPLGPYLDSVAARRDQPGAPFWTAFGLPGLARRWSHLVGADRVVLVPAPPPGSDPAVLWHRFATAAGLGETLIETLGAADTTRQRADDNLSLTPSQAELIRQLNLVVQSDGISRARQQQVRARLLGIWMNLPPETGRPRLTLPERLREDVARWAEEDVTLLQRQAVRVVGSLTDLIPRLSEVEPGAQPPSVDPRTARDVLALLEHVSRPPAANTRTSRWPALLNRTGVPQIIDLACHDEDGEARPRRPRRRRV